MLIDTHNQFAGAASTPLLGNPVVPVIGARARHAIDCLNADEIDGPGGDALARVADQVRLTPLAIDARSARWHAGASDCDGRPGLKVEVVLDYRGDRSLFAVLPWGVDSAPVTVAITDTSLIVTAFGVVENPEDLIAPLREAVERIERSVAIQALHVAQANAALMSLAVILLRRRVRRDAAAAPADQFQRPGLVHAG
ncbi:hypothetical protein [Sphingomonas bacterium]|uniref:hypothetical protein n=1 Tax=Sphingomonas bacterium TaxID=1895847 RepID=UPI002617CF02|nr:hypothetical protein [Sphingomonas bacterium]MDB5678508.1 hypothetical protein [Sphingomonas bacterium]